MYLLAVDPGAHIGWALAFRGRLVACGTTSDASKLPRASVLVIEFPRIYPSAAKWKGDPQDVVKLAARAGQIEALWRPHARMRIEPRAWRGGAPETVVRRRTNSRLDYAERAIVQTAKASAHCWDALGILVKVLRRNPVLNT